MDASRSRETENSDRMYGYTRTPCKDVNWKEVGHLLSSISSHARVNRLPADWADLELPQTHSTGGKLDCRGQMFGCQESTNQISSPCTSAVSGFSETFWQPQQRSQSE